MSEASKGYVSLFDLGETKDDSEVDYNSLYMHHYQPDSKSSTPDIVKPREVLDEVDADTEVSPFRPSWMYGFNTKLPVLSLYTLKEQMMVMAGSNHVVLMNVKKKEQFILEGHKNPVTCLGRSHSGSYIVSGDTGADHHAVFVWSVLSRRPVLKMINPHSAPGVECVQFTSDDKYLITVSVSAPSSQQSVRYCSYIMSLLIGFHEM